MNERRRGARARSHRAFSLIEVMVSGALFLLALTGVVSAVSSASSLRSDSRLHGIAADLAQERMELLLAAARGAPVLSPTATHVETRDHSGALSAAGPFTVRWTIATLPSVPSASRVRVQVDYRAGNRDRTVSLETNRD